VISITLPRRRKNGGVILQTHQKRGSENRQGMVVLGYAGNPYTWSNKKDGPCKYQREARQGGGEFELENLIPKGDCETPPSYRISSLPSSPKHFRGPANPAKTLQI
ncbi:unnamed protein product, partial [Ilex paraguariensis]